MSHTPLGYRIENGKAEIDEPAAEQVRNLFRNYLSGMALVSAASEAGIETYHATVSKMLANRRYIGDDFYPQIIEEETIPCGTTGTQKPCIKTRSGSLCFRNSHS